METMSSKKEYLDEKLIAYGQSDYYPFHMPGHKRQRMGEWTAEEIDITEIDGFDDLHHARDVLKDAQERLAALCGADRSFYLVNGSTAGILAAVCGCVRKNDRVLIARNCHRSVYHAAYLMELKLQYLYPEPTQFGIQGSVAPSHVREMLERYPDVSAVVLTSPTYDGVVSDIASIAQIVHERGIPLIVDEAHGAHFGFSEDFPKKAVVLGADLCIESLHKTLPSYTQTAVLHMNRTGRFDPERVMRYLGIFQTSSPSYVLMAGMDRCVRILKERRDLFPAFSRKLDHFYQSCRDLKNIRILPCRPDDPGIWDRDPSKILILTRDAQNGGQQLYEILLNQYHLQMEMASGHYVTAITTIMDTAEGFERLEKALHEMDGRAICETGAVESRDRLLTPEEIYRPREKRLEIAQALEAEKHSLALTESAGCISASYVCLYPPGIPVIVPGEVIDRQMLEMAGGLCRQGFELQGAEDGRIAVVDHGE